MEELGYETVQFRQGNHDSYQKLPYINVELHREMVPERSGTYDYYQNVWLKAVEDVERQGVYHLSWDDYYIFMIVHFAKHYFAGAAEAVCGPGAESAGAGSAGSVRGSRCGWPGIY